jgi:hypothetical protein
MVLPVFLGFFFYYIVFFPTKSSVNIYFVNFCEIYSASFLGCRGYVLGIEIWTWVGE